jgi:methylated-DNA-protein-cysteine methyltransferase-like protein
MNRKNTFSSRVIDIALSIPKGRVTTYGRIARAAGGGPLSSQSVTGILGKAYKEKGLPVPFHRIVYANGKIWINNTHKKEREKLYKKENILIDWETNTIKNFKEILLEFM